MAKIAIDIDETLVSFTQEVREEFFELAIETGDKKYLRGAYADFNEWRNLADVFEWDVVMDIINRVHEKQQYHVPYRNSADVVTCLSMYGHEIKYITARESRFYDPVINWLGSNDFPEGEVICLDPSVHDKRKAMADCQYLIEDRPKTIIQFLNSGPLLRTIEFGRKWKFEEKKVFGLWKPHNRNLTDIKNVYLAPTWRGIEYYLQEKGVL